MNIVEEEYLSKAAITPLAERRVSKRKEGAGGDPKRKRREKGKYIKEAIGFCCKGWGAAPRLLLSNYFIM